MLESDLPRPSNRLVLDALNLIFPFEKYISSGKTELIKTSELVPVALILPPAPAA